MEKKFQAEFGSNFETKSYSDTTSTIRRASDIPGNIDWEEVLDRIKKKSNPQVFFWFSPLKVVSQNSGEIVLKANNSFDRDWINNHYIDFIVESVREIYSKNIVVKIICESEQTENKKFAKTNEALSVSRPVKNTSSLTFFSGFLNPNNTFENFVVGPSNQFAHAASLAVSRKPGESYNPLFIYGGVGLGKTHLLNAVGNHISKATSNLSRVCIISAEHFTNEVINSIKSNKMEDFRNKYRLGCDVLLIDDIQFIAGKESTQEEFFHTFNALYESKKQIILTSDKTPRDMSYLEERLRSRFQWGLITDIQPPEIETRIAILKKMAESENIIIPDEVSNFLAQNIISNVRELEGTLINIIGYAKLLNSEITIDLAKQVLKNILKNDDRKVLSIETIQKEVSNYFGIKIYDIKSSKKQKNIAFPRQISMYLVRRYTGASYPEIGEKFGGKDHSTVIHAVKKIENLIKDDLSIKNTINSLSRTLESLRG